MGFEPPSLRLLSANAGKSDRSNPVTFSLPSGWRTHTEHFINNNNNNNSELQLKHWEVFSAPVPLKMLLERELFMLKPGFLFTPNPDILTHKHTHTGLLSDTSFYKHGDLTRMKDLLVTDRKCL